MYVVRAYSMGVRQKETTRLKETQTMTYQSKAAVKRRRRRNAYLVRRNTVIRYGGIVVFGITGILLGLVLVKTFMPDHPIWR